MIMHQYDILIVLLQYNTSENQTSDFHGLAFTGISRKGGRAAPSPLST